MHLTEIRINLCGDGSSRLRAFCSLTIDDTFVIHDVKLIDGPDGLFLAMPSRKLCDRCDRCGDKNHLRARYCNHCGSRLNENRYLRYQNGNSSTHHPRIKLHADIAHPINAACRQVIHAQVVDAFHKEVERSKQPGYVAPRLDTDDCSDYFLDTPLRATTATATATATHLRPTGTAVH
jgi:stage V sporulation protein G